MGWIAALLGALAVVAGLLAIPFRIRIVAAKQALGEPVQGSVRLSWAFGLLDFPLARPKDRGRRRAATPHRAAPKRRRLRLKRLLTHQPFRSRIKQLLLRLFSAVDWRVFHLDARIGLGDPADTGVAWGLLSPLLINLSARPDVNIRPVFDEAEFAFEGEGEVRLVPLRILWPLLLFFAAPATWQGLWLARETR